MINTKNRCSWVNNEQIYIDYHDNEWGVPVFNDQRLFEMLILEGSQAGLSWITILKRRDAYHQAYNQFDAEKIAKWSDKKIASLLADSAIIRNRLKINAARTNAIAYLNIIKTQSFSDYLWQFVDNKVQHNHFKHFSDIPVNSPASKAMGKDLNKRGFKFVGPTICYAFMQAVGMVNDHDTNCFRFNEICNNTIIK